MSSENVYTPFLDVLLKTAGNPAMPDGYDTWGYKITRADLRTWAKMGSTTRFQWPFPGGTVTDPNTVVDGYACPTAGRGGYCIALSLAGAASGNYGHGTILLLAYRSADIAGEDAGSKRRVSHCLVVDLIAGRDAYRQAAGADLADANLTGADLTDADLTGANLARAWLTGANLTGADLTGANLTGAWLARANLAGANLTGAWLAGANLTGAWLACADLAGASLACADLADADLTDADLTDADLTDANLTGANLTGANLAGANLAGADLTGANLTGTRGLPS